MFVCDFIFLFLYSIVIYKLINACRFLFFGVRIPEYFLKIKKFKKLFLVGNQENAWFFSSSGRDAKSRQIMSTSSPGRSFIPTLKYIEKPSFLRFLNQKDITPKKMIKGMKHIQLASTFNKICNNELSVLMVSLSIFVPKCLFYH